MHIAPFNLRAAFGFCVIFYLIFAVMQNLILFVAFIGLTISIHCKVQLVRAKEVVKQQDSTISWLENRYKMDSVLLNDLKTLSTTDEIKQIFKLNKRPWH